MSKAPSVPDASVRRLAETTFDRNVVVIAGAGTGKTTLLVNRLLQTLMREPRSSITQVVALTFTNKAAAEMKIRLRERLVALVESNHDARAGDPGAAGLREQYGLSADRIAERAEAALCDLEKAQVGTLHSFAAHLLRLHPFESGVDPDFREDDGLLFEEHFTAQWELWLDAELGVTGSDHPRWRRLIVDLGLEQIREVAYALCSELVPLEELTRQVEEGGLTPALREWMNNRRARAMDLLTRYDRPKPRKAESCLGAALELFEVALERGMDGLATLGPDVKQELARELGDCPQDWEEEEFTECGSLVRIAKRLLAVDQAGMRDLMTVLTPFVQRARTTFRELGWMSFDGLLARARALLRDHPAIRERLKHEYRAILVDEFQDNDPSQYEILLYLTERPGRAESDWRAVELEPGKLFIVGDPKQSIYAFRRADMEAFDQVVNKIRSSDGVVHELITNFRSHGALLDVVNAVFDRLFQRKENLQPPNVTLAVRPGREGGARCPGVELRLIAGDEDEDELDAAAVTRIEADALASWLKEDLLAHETLTDAAGQSTPLQPGHVALLFRKLTQAQDYLDALRRHGIPYITDGEKHFYRRQEVVDLVNLLRIVENPHDGVALIGVLRSPLGGLTDRETFELHERDALDYRMPDRLTAWSSPRASAVRSLYERLNELHRTAPLWPLPDVVDSLFSHVPVLELAAASLHGEQAVANLLKIRHMAAELADRPHLTLSGFVELMIERLTDQPNEAESALAEESLEAVRVLTVHKAKGLEFPVVILAGLHHGERPGRADAYVSHDWSTGVVGLSLGERCSLGAVLIGEKLRAREEAERRRVLYVGMTRAKERLVLSGGLAGRSARGTFLSLLEEAAGVEIGLPEQPAIPIGAVSLPQVVIKKPDRIGSPRKPELAELAKPPDWTNLVRRWEERDRVWKAACATRRHLTPSLLGQKTACQPAAHPQRRNGASRTRLIGTLAHRVLEHWDFGCDPADLHQRMEAICRFGIPQGLGDEAEIRAEVEDMLTAFAASEVYADLRRATILGREVPFSIPWGDGRQVMEGAIDLVYRLDGQ
ncbi:MAG: UvrD-helicase domain-containing protein, partial [Nitrospiraceae bacterium]